MAIPSISDIAGIIQAPELKYTNSGKAILNLRLAFNDSRYNDQTKQWDNTKTFYVDAQAWEDTAIRLSERVAQGDQVYVTGRIETQSWEKDGEKKSKPVLNIQAMRKLEKGPVQGQQNTQQRPAQQPAQGGWGGNQASSSDWGNGNTDAAPF